jgi:hypothetical protein
MFTNAVTRWQYCTCSISTSINTRSFLKRSIGFRGQALQVRSSKADLLTRSLHTGVRSLTNSSASSCLAARHIESRGQNLQLRRSSLLNPPSARAPFYILSTPYLPRQRSFSATSFAMTATKIDGTAVAKQIRERLRAEIVETQKTNPRYRPSLKIIQGIA